MPSRWSLNERSLFLVAGLVISLCGGLLLLVRDREASRDALTWWAVAMLLGGVGVLLLADYGSWPRLLCSELSRALLLLAGGSSWTAARIFSGNRPRLAVAASGAALWLLACQIPEFAVDEALQTTTATGIAGLYVLATAGELWRGRAERLRSRNPAIVLLMIHLIALIVRGWMARLAPERGDRCHADQWAAAGIDAAHDRHGVAVAVADQGARPGTGVAQRRGGAPHQPGAVALPGPYEPRAAHPAERLAGNCPCAGA